MAEKGFTVFKNVMIYKVDCGWPTEVEVLENALADQRFTPCTATQEMSAGWIEPRGHAHGPLVEVVNGQWILHLYVETKSVPAAVIKRKVQEQVDRIEAESGRKPGKKERRMLADDARLSLLPVAFTKQHRTQVWMDPVSGLLVTDAGSSVKADQVMSSLVQVVHGLSVRLLQTQNTPQAAMAHWLTTREAPVGFSVERECELKAPDESKSVVRYARHALDTDEVVQHIHQGKLPTRLALSWADRIAFVLTESLQLKKTTFLDTVFEGNSARQTEEDSFDADVAIATGELRQMLATLIAALGGEAMVKD